MGASNETDKTREQTAKEPENASHLPDKLVAQRREVAEKVARDMEELGSGWKQPWVQAGAPMNPATGPSRRGRRPGMRTSRAEGRVKALDTTRYRLMNTQEVV